MICRIFAFIAAIFLSAPLTTGAHAAEAVTHIDNPAVLRAVETRGHGFSALFGNDKPSGLDKLYVEAPAYKAIVDLIAADVAQLRAEMKAGGRPLYEVTDGNVGRVIDMRWLKTGAARFRLVGIVNRLDRSDFAALHRQRTCGEVRFIYRLAYEFKRKGRVLASRLPFNFNAVFTAPPDSDGGCVGIAKRWIPADDETVDAGWLAAGALDPAALTFKQLELNAQIVRFPSGQETEFGGQAAYLMRIFGIHGDTITENPLENTPDVAAIAADPALKAELATYVRANAPWIDNGVYVLPERLLARKAISWATYGSARAANHPASAVLAAADLAGIDFSALTFAKSPEALLERLDNGACQGCHQSGSTAGFHFIGLDDERSSPLNRILVGISPHLDAELPRRRAVLAAVSEGREAPRFRALSSAPRADWNERGKPGYKPAGVGMPCLMPPAAAGFGATWSCEAGLVCTPIAATKGTRFEVAQCLLPEKSKEMFSGHPCLAGEIETNAAQPFNDRFKITRQFAAFAKQISREDHTCRPPAIGVPGGIAYRGCTDADRRFAGFKSGEPLPREICGLAGGKAFDICVATNDFDQCLGGAVVRGNRPTCSPDRLCREDYMCQAFPADTPGLAKAGGAGFCSPTYFLFQMRIDNHPSPWQG